MLILGFLVVCVVHFIAFVLLFLSALFFHMARIRKTRQAIKVKKTMVPAISAKSFLFMDILLQFFCFYFPANPGGPQ